MFGYFHELFLMTNLEVSGMALWELIKRMICPRVPVLRDLRSRVLFNDYFVTGLRVVSYVL